MYGTLIIVVSTLTYRKFKDKIMNIVFEVSWRTQTMTRSLEIISDVGLFCRAWLFFSVHISADSCTLNLLYVISKLSCKIDQRELEHILMHHIYILCLLLYHVDVSCELNRRMYTFYDLTVVLYILWLNYRMCTFHDFQHSIQHMYIQLAITWYSAVLILCNIIFLERKNKNCERTRVA